MEHVRRRVVCATPIHGSFRPQTSFRTLSCCATVRATSMMRVLLNYGTAGAATMLVWVGILTTSYRNPSRMSVLSFPLLWPLWIVYWMVIGAQALWQGPIADPLRPSPKSSPQHLLCSVCGQTIDGGCFHDSQHDEWLCPYHWTQRYFEREEEKDRS